MVIVGNSSRIQHVVLIYLSSSTELRISKCEKTEKISK
jgi:hypothetical protein